MKNEVRHLINVGLTEEEAIVYISLTELGQGTAYRISRISGLKQPTVYVILESLREKGLLLKVPHSKKQLFIAKDLTEYLQNIEDSLLGAKRMNDKFIQNKKELTPSVTYYEGVDGVKESIYYRLSEFENETFMQIYGPLDTDVKRDVMQEYLDWNKKALLRNNRQHILIPHQTPDQFKEISRYSNPKNYIIRPIDKINLPHNLSLEVNSKFVRIISTKPYEATIIEDKKVIEVFSQFFKYFWADCKENI